MDTETQRIATDSNETETLDEILRTLTVEQLRFVVARQNCNSDAEAAKTIGISKGTVSRWPDNVEKAVRLMLLDGVHVAQELLRRALNDAVQVKIDGLQSRHENIKQAAATEIIDRMMGKPTQRQEVTGKDGTPLVINWGGDESGD